MKVFCVLFLAIVGTSLAFSPFASIFQEEWETYKVKHNKNYSGSEDALRLNTFLQNKMRVAEHNQRYYEGKETFLIEINKFSDMLPHEKEQYTGLKYDEESAKEGAATYIPPHDDVAIPDFVDWREKGAVSEVKDQGFCGSCYAFSSTGSLEGQHFRKTGKLVSLSEQNLVDCVPDPKGRILGCKGGLMSWSFDYIKKNGGIDTEESYPYLARDGICHFSNKTIGATDYSYVRIKEKDEELLKKAVATVGPISVAIQVSETGLFKYYKKGVFYDPTCSSSPYDLNHGVLIVGYGTTDKGQDYWIVKNSWGTDFGMNGYILMSRNRNNNCGIAFNAIYPLV